MFITALFLWVYLIIGLVWTAQTAHAIGHFFEGETIEDKMDRIAAFMISVIAWPFILLIPRIEGYIEGYKDGKNEREQGET